MARRIRNRKKKLSLQPKERAVVASERIERLIFLIGGHKVMLDADLAKLYGVTTARLNEQVKTQRRALPIGLYVSINKSGIRGLEIANCDIKIRMGRALKTPFCLH